MTKITKMSTQRKKLNRASSGGILRQIIDLKPREVMTFRYYDENNQMITKTIKCISEEGY